MADVKRCDQTGETATTSNPDGWFQVSIRQYGNGGVTVQADVKDGPAAVAWLQDRLAEWNAWEQLEADPEPEPVKKRAATKKRAPKRRS